MRQLDNWQTYLNRNGKPLRGRLTFYKLHTTEKANIYNEKFEVLSSNPINTNIIGQTEKQVFLDDIDYTIKLEIYNGGDPSEESSWAELRTFDNLYPAMTTETITSNSAKAFHNIQSLRDTDWTTIPVIKEGEAPVITIKGYYEEGDMPEVNYVLVEDSTSVDDGGSILRADSTHIWKLIPSHILDVRVFGVFPAEDYMYVTARYSQLRLAFSYADAHGLDVYMPSVYASGGYYMLEGGVHFINSRLHLDAKVYISGKDDTTSLLNVNEIEYSGDGPIFTNLAGNGTINIITGTVKTSWLNKAWDAIPSGGEVKKIIIDVLRSPRFNFKDNVIEITGDIVSKTLSFTNCQFTNSNNNHLDSCNLTISRCEGAGDKLTKDNNCSLVDISDNNFVLSNFTNASNYIKWMNAEQNYNYGDLEEQTISDVTLYPGGSAMNFAGSATVASESFIGATYEFHNASITLSGAISLHKFNLVDTWITFTNTSAIDSLVIRRGSIISSSAIRIMSSCILYNTDINAPLNLYGLTGIIIEDSSVTSQIDIIGHDNFRIIKNKFESGSKIVYTGDANKIYGTFKDNTFREGSDGIVVKSNVASTSVYCAWVGNHSDMSSQFVTFDFTNLYTYDSMHTYIYENNTGLHTLQKEIRTSYIDKESNAWIETGAAPVGKSTLGENWNFVLCKSSYLLFSSDNKTARQALEGFYVYSGNDMIPVTSRNVFSIGTRYIKMKVTVQYEIPSTFWNTSGTERTTCHDFSGTFQLTVEDNVVDASNLDGKTIGSVSFAGHNMVGSETHGTFSDYYPIVTVEIF